MLGLNRPLSAGSILRGGRARKLIALTLSGNEITDVTRKAALLWGTAQSGGSVDQFTPPDSSFGIWELATNLHTRGQCDGGVGVGGGTPWIPDGGVGTVSVDATTPAPFSPRSMKCVTTAAGNGINAQTPTGQAAAAGTNLVGSIWFKGVAGNSYQSRVMWFNTDATFSFGAWTPFVATGNWQYVSVAPATVTAAKTGDYGLIRVDTVTAVDTFWVAHPMLQSGVAAVSPYVATSGGVTATSNAARVQAPASLINATQCWIAARVRVGFASTVVAGSNRIVFQYGDDDSSRLVGYYDTTAGRWSFVRKNATVGGTVQAAAQAFAAGDALTLVFAVDAANVKVSVNGAAFVSIADAHIPAPIAARFDIGGKGDGLSNLDGDVLWFAAGTGTLTDANASAINAFGNRDMNPWEFPGGCKAVWHANTSYAIAA